MFEKQIEIPSSEEIIAEQPVSREIAAIKRERDKRHHGKIG